MSTRTDAYRRLHKLYRLPQQGEFLVILRAHRLWAMPELAEQNSVMASCATPSRSRAETFSSDGAGKTYEFTQVVCELIWPPLAPNVAN